MQEAAAAVDGVDQGGSAAPGMVAVGELGGISVPRETDGQASGGSDSGDWIFTIREKDPKNLENGTFQPSDLERNKVPPAHQPVAPGNPLTISRHSSRRGPQSCSLVAFDLRELTG